MQHLIHPRRHAQKTAADVDRCAVVQPYTQFSSSLAQAILYVDLFRLITGESQVQASQTTRLKPALKLGTAMKVVGAVTFTEQQPVARLPLSDAGLEQAAQAGQPCAVAQQNQRDRFSRQMKAAVATHAQTDRTVEDRMFGQPAGTQPQTAVSMNLLTHNQLQAFFLGNRSNRVLTSGYRHQRIDQRLCMQPHQMRTVVRQLAGCQCLSKRFLQALNADRAQRINAQTVKALLDDLRSVARHHLDQITCLPAHQAGCRQLKPEHLGATAAWVQMLATGQRPVLENRCLPVGQRQRAGQLPQLLLPMLQSGRIGAVHLDRRK